MHLERMRCFSEYRELFLPKIQILILRNEPFYHPRARFFHGLVDVVVKMLGEAFPNLKEDPERVSSTIFTKRCLDCLQPLE